LKIRAAATQRCVGNSWDATSS